MQRSIGKGKYEFIDAGYAAAAADTATTAATIRQMCEWLGVSKSGFYGWRSNPGSAAARRMGEIKLFIKKAFGDSDGTYGYRRGARPAAPLGRLRLPGTS